MMAASNLEEEEPFRVAELALWNGIQVSFNIPSEAALRLKHLADHGDAVMNDLGILSVHIDDQVSTPSLNSHLSEPQNIVFQNADEHVNGSTSIPLDLSESNSSIGSSTVETTRKNIAQYLRQQGSLVPSSLGLQLGGAGSPFVCPTKVSLVDSPNGLYRTTVNAKQSIKCHSSSVGLTNDSEIPLVQSSEFSHLPHEHIAKTCNTQSNFSPFVGLNQVKNTKYASTHHQPVIQAHGYSSRFNFSPPPGQLSFPPISLEQSNSPDTFNDTKLTHPLYTPFCQKAPLTKSVDPPYNAFCSQVAPQNTVVPMLTTSQGNVALSSPMLVNLLKSEPGSSHASKMMPPPLLPSKQVQRRKQRARKSKVVPPSNMSLSSSASFSSFETSNLSPLKPSIADVQAPISSSDCDTYNNEPLHLTLPRITGITASSPFTATSKIHPWREEQSHQSVITQQKQILSDISPIARLSTNTVTSNGKAFPLDSNFSSNETSLCHPENKNICNIAKNPPPSLSSYTDCKTKPLIHPFTKQSETLAFGKIDDSNHSFNSDNVLSDFQIDTSKSKRVDKASVSGEEKVVPDTNVENQSSLAVFQPLFKHGNPESYKKIGENCFSDNKVKKYLKSGHSPPLFSVHNSPGEELKVRLKIDSKVYGSGKEGEITRKQSEFINIPHSLQQICDNESSVHRIKEGNPCHVQYPIEEPRVPPLHISLKGHHASVVKHSKKDHIRKRSFDSAKTFCSLKQTTRTYESQLSKHKSQNSHDLLSTLSPKHEVTNMQITGNSYTVYQKREDTTHVDQNWCQNTKILFHENVSNLGLKSLPTKDMQHIELDRSLCEVSSNSNTSPNSCHLSSSLNFTEHPESSKPKLHTLYHEKYKIANQSKDVSPLCVHKSSEVTDEKVRTEISTVPSETHTSVCFINAKVTDDQPCTSQQNTNTILLTNSQLSCHNEYGSKDSILVDNEANVIPHAALVSSPLNSTYRESVHLKINTSDISVRNLSSEVLPKEIVDEGGSQNNTSVIQDMQTSSCLPHLPREEPLKESGTTFLSRDCCNSNSPKSANSIPSVLCDTPDSHRSVTCSANERDELPNIISDTNEPSALEAVQTSQEEEAKDSDVSSPTEDTTRILLTSHHHFETPPDSRSPVSLNATSSDKVINEELNHIAVTDKLAETTVSKTLYDTSPDDKKGYCRNINKALKRLSFESEENMDDDVHISSSVGLDKKETNSATVSPNSSFQLTPLISDVEEKVKCLDVERGMPDIEQKASSPNKNVIEHKSNESQSVSINLTSCSSEANSLGVHVDRPNPLDQKNSKNSLSPLASQYKVVKDFHPMSNVENLHHIEDDISVDVKDISLVQDFKKINISNEMKSRVAKIISLPLQNIPHMVEVPSLHPLQIVPKIKSAKIESFETSSIPSLIPSHGNAIPNVTLSTHQYGRECISVESESRPVKSVTIHSSFIASPSSELGAVSVMNVNMCGISHNEKDKILDETQGSRAKIKRYSPVKQECDSTISSDESSLDSVENLNENQPFPLRISCSEYSVPTKKCNTLPQLKSEMCRKSDNLFSLEKSSDCHISSDSPCKSENSASNASSELPENSSLMPLCGGATSSSECHNSEIIGSDVTHDIGGISDLNKTAQNDIDRSCVKKPLTSQDDVHCPDENKACLESSESKLSSITNLPNAANSSTSHSNENLLPEIVADNIINTKCSVGTTPKCTESNSQPEIVRLSTSNVSSSGTQESSQTISNSNPTPSSISNVSQTENSLQSSISGAGDISSSGKILLQNNVEETKSSPLFSTTKSISKTCVRITPEISAGNRVRLILKGSLNNLSVTNQSASSSTLVVPFNKCKGVPIKFVALPGKSSALSVRSTSNPSVVEIIGSTSSPSKISSSTHSSPVRLVVSKVSSGKSNVAAMLVKSVMTGTGSSIKLIPASDTPGSTISATPTSVMKSSSISSEVKSSSNTSLEKNQQYSSAGRETINNLSEPSRSGTEQDSLPVSVKIVKYNENTHSESLDNQTVGLSVPIMSRSCSQLDPVGVEKTNSNVDAVNCISSSIDVVCSGIVSSSKNPVINMNSNKDEMKDKKVTTFLKNSDNCKGNSLLSDLNNQVFDTELFKQAEKDEATICNENIIQSLESGQSEVISSSVKGIKVFADEIPKELNMLAMHPVRPSSKPHESETVGPKESEQNYSDSILNERLKSDSSAPLDCSESTADSSEVSIDRFQSELLCEKTKDVHSKDQYKGSTGKHHAIHSLLVSEKETTYCKMASKCTVTAGSFDDGCFHLGSELAKGNVTQSTKDNIYFTGTRHGQCTSECKKECLVDEADNISLNVEEISNKQQQESEDLHKEASSEFPEVT